MAFPLPWGWTALPNFGAIDRGQHDPGFARRHPDRGESRASTTGPRRSAAPASTGRVYVSATVTSNTFEFDSSFLQAWAPPVRRAGQRPVGDLDAPDHHDRQRLELRGPRALCRPAVPLDRRRRADPLRRRQPHLRRPDRELAVTMSGNARRADLGRRHGHRAERPLRPGLRRDGQRRHARSRP